MNWLNRLENKYRKYAVSNLMNYIIGLYILGFGLDFLGIFSFYEMSLIPIAVTDYGQYWRLLTFVMVPPTNSILFFAFVVAFYYYMGNTLEANWGSFKFNIYYFSGILFNVVAAFITGVPVTTTYINLTLFLAFARLYPNFQVNLYFILPVKIKYLAWLQWAGYAFVLVTGSNSVRVMVVIAIMNYLLYFGKDLFSTQKAYSRKQQYKKKVQVKKDSFHRCEVCGKTEIDDPNLEFRYCSKCNGKHEYCSEHLFNHQHK